MTAKIKMKDVKGKSKIMTQKEIEDVRRKLANDVPGVTFQVSDNNPRNRNIRGKKDAKLS